jgi:hypothetical protein
VSDVTVELLNRRTAIAAVRQEAARIGVDSEGLLDSQRLHQQLAGLDPDEPGFTGRIRELVGEAAGRLGGDRPAAEPDQEMQQGPRQWTLEDVKSASGDELLTAMNAGRLTSLGIGPEKRRR